MGTKSLLCTLALGGLAIMTASPMQAAEVKVTPLGGQEGELCPQDRALVFEDPNGTRILYDAGRTVEWLERDWARQRGNALFILADPFVLRFRDDPRFIAFCRKIGLAPPDGSDALSLDQIRSLASGRQVAL